MILTDRTTAKPVLKWAGGKTQLLKVLLPNIPLSYGKYIEPFLGGGALFFALNPNNAVISDSNPELVNLYKVIASNVEELITELKLYNNSADFFYEQRNFDWKSLQPIKAAARTIFLNKTCFNGIYRINKQGFFNVPYGQYKKPTICDEKNLINVSKVLHGKTIICGDYKSVLNQYAKPGDFIFLDPPYVPISKSSDFKRYTQQPFSMNDHIELASEVKRLHEIGCHVILTNSDHPHVHSLYDKFDLRVCNTRRSVNSKISQRQGKDIVVCIRPSKEYLSPLSASSSYSNVMMFVRSNAFNDSLVVV